MAILGIDASPIAPTRPTKQTGVQRYTGQLLQSLLPLFAHDENHVRLYGATDCPPILKEAIHGQISWRRLRGLRAWTQTSLPLELALHMPDMLFIPVLFQIPWIHPRKIVVTCHDLAFERFPEVYAPRELARLRAASKQMVKYATHVIAVSEATKKDITELYQLPQERISVVYHGIDTKHFTPPTKDMIAHVTQSYGIMSPYILTTGRIELKKNLLRLVQAFALLLKKQHSPLTLVFAGMDGEGASQIRDEVERRGLLSRVRFTGYIPDEHYPALLAGAQSFIFPSLYEGFGMPILEAFASGVPVCASRSSSLPEVGGDAAIWFDPQKPEDMAQAMEQLIEDQSLRADLIQKGMRRARGFSWETSARKTYDILQSILRS